MFVLSTVVKLVTGLLGLFIVTRLVGKKALSEFTPFDFIYALVLGGILESGLFMTDVRFWHILLALAVWGALIFFIEAVVETAGPIKTWVKGTPSVLVLEGKVNAGELKRSHIELEQLRGMLRQEGCFSLGVVDNLVMETDGQVSLMRSEEGEDAFTYMLIDEKDVEPHALEAIGKDEAWLRESLADIGHTDTNRIFYAEWSKKNGFYVVCYEDTIDEKLRFES